MIWKNVKHRARLALQRLSVVSRFDVLLEPGAIVKYADTLFFGTHTTVQAGAYVYGSRKGARVELGDHVVVAAGAMLLGEGGMTIGAFTHVGPHAVLTTQYGDASGEMLTDTPSLKTAPIRIGRGSWIGSGAVLMPGAELGDRCVVAPNAVVFGKWPDGSTLAGNPARRERKLIPTTFARA